MTTRDGSAECENGGVTVIWATLRAAVLRQGALPGTHCRTARNNILHAAKVEHAVTCGRDKRESLDSGYGMDSRVDGGMVDRCTLISCFTSVQNPMGATTEQRGLRSAYRILFPVVL